MYKDKVLEINDELVRIYGHNKIWIDKTNVATGNSLDSLIKAIADSFIFLCFLCQEYVASKKCLGELNLAFSRKKEIIFVTIEDKYLKYTDILNQYLPKIQAIMANRAMYRYDNLDGLKNCIDITLSNLRLSLQNETLMPTISLPNAILRSFLPTNICYADRSSLIQKIKTCLEANSYVILSGVAGVGKSACACEYGFRLSNTNTVRWIFASSFQNVYNDFKDIAACLGIDTSNMAHKDLFDAVQIKLESTHILFIFDNVQRLTDIDDIYQRLVRNKNCRILITTRNERNLIDLNLPVIQINSFTLIESKAYVEKALATKSQKQSQIDDILASVCSHSDNEVLAVELNFALNLLKQDSVSIVSDSIINSLFAYLEKSATVAWNIFRFCALFETDFVYSEIILRAIESNCLDIQNHLDQLKSLGLINVVSKSNGKSGFLVHPFFRTPLLNYLTVKTRETLQCHLLRILNGLIRMPSDLRDETWETSAECHNQAVELIETTRIDLFDTENNQIKIDLYEKFSTFNSTAMLNFLKSLEYHEIVLKMKQELQELGLLKYDACALTLANIGSAYRNLGDSSRALQYHIDSLNTYKKYNSGDSVDAANFLMNIGQIYIHLGDLNSALQHYLNALEMRKKVYETDNADTAYSLYSVGIVQMDLGEKYKALQSHTEALCMRKRLFPGDHPDTAKSLNNVGFAYCNHGDKNISLEYHMEALDMKKRLFLRDHPDIAASLNNIGNVYSNFGDNRKALEFHMQSLEMKERLFTGEAHPYTAASLNNIGNVYSSLGDNTKALKYHMKSLETYRRFFDGDHPYIATTLDNIALVYIDIGNTNLALQYLTESLEMYIRFFNGDHLDIARSFSNLGSVHKKRGNKKMALQFYNESYQMYRRLFEGDHPLLVETMKNIAKMYKKLGEKHKSLYYFAESNAMQKRLFGGDAVYTESASCACSIL